MRHFNLSGFLQKIEWTLGSLHRLPWETQTFPEGSAEAERLNNTAVDIHTGIHYHFSTLFLSVR